MLRVGIVLVGYSMGGLIAGTSCAWELSSLRQHPRHQGGRALSRSARPTGDMRCFPGSIATSCALSSSTRCRIMDPAVSKSLTPGPSSYRPPEIAIGVSNIGDTGWRRLARCASDRNVTCPILYDVLGSVYYDGMRTVREIMTASSAQTVRCTPGIRASRATPTQVFDDPSYNYSHTDAYTGVGTWRLMGCETGCRTGSVEPVLATRQWIGSISYKS